MGIKYSERQDFLDKKYNSIIMQRKKYGQLKKCEFHIHTPVSSCYRFISAGDNLEGKDLYSKLSTRQVIDYSLEVGYLSQHQYDEIINNLQEYESDEYRSGLKNKSLPYESFKEYITYMTIAYKLYVEGIKVAVISDHNTIQGYKKLEFAVNKYCLDTYHNYQSVIKLFLGVEISCSDKNHVIVIYDEKRLDELERYLEDIILTQDLGTYYDSRKVIEDMKKCNAITYIAHINTSDLLGNGAYKQKLFNNDGLTGIGLTNIGVLERQIERIKPFRKDTSGLAVVYEGDSHAINEIGVKNTWIKLSNMNFKSLKKAFLNHRVSIYTEEQSPVDKYIKGLIVERGENGFLGDKLEKIDKGSRGTLIIDFSQDLNCIIGGRGSGKSTILNILEIIYSMECNDLDLLNYICQHKRIYSIFIKNQEEYLLEFIPQVSMKGSYRNFPVILRGSYFKSDNTYKLRTHWYNAFKITYENGIRRYIEIDNKEIPYLLKSVFRRGYNINKLVDKINNKEISDYIKEIVTYNVNYEDINNYIRKIKGTPSTRVLKVIRESLDDIIIMVQERRKSFGQAVSSFNSINSKILHITYQPMYEIDEYFECFLSIFEKDLYENDSEKVLAKNVGNTYLTWGDVQDYFSELVREKNYLEILDLLLNKKFVAMNNILEIEKFQNSDLTFSHVNKGLIEMSKDNRKEVFTQIFNKVKNNSNVLVDSVIKCFKVMDNFDIEFNINFKEDVQNETLNFKSIKELSLGQKVVALLTFVFNFGNIVGDNTPLIIDQPEDNLDNVYIYKTLVESLKAIKNSRQVIIVTHSSTIVTNADAEEVIVMKSNGRIGWVEKSGYPSDEVITNHIINYLEGGISSFNHKKKMYSVILDKLK